MLRKTLCLIFPSILVTSTWATGFYLGAGTGVETADFYQYATISQPGNFYALDKEHLAGEGIFGSLFGGYGWICRQFFLAGELNANLSSVAFNSSNSELVHQNFSSTEFKINHSFGASLLPGFLLTPNTLFYGRAGYSRGHFVINTSDSSLANVDTNLNGFRYGLGVKQTICKKLSAFLDYSRIEYRSTNIFTLDIHSNTSKATTISPDVNQFQIGLIYDFA